MSNLAFVEFNLRPLLGGVTILHEVFLGVFGLVVYCVGYDWWHKQADLEEWESERVRPSEDGQTDSQTTGRQSEDKERQRGRKQRIETDQKSRPPCIFYVGIVLVSLGIILNILQQAQVRWPFSYMQGSFASWYFCLFSSLFGSFFVLC